MRRVRPALRFDAERPQSCRNVRVQAGKLLRAHSHPEPEHPRGAGCRKRAKPSKLGIEAARGNWPIDGAQDLVGAIGGYLSDEPESDVKVGAGNPPRVDTTFELATERIRDCGRRVAYGIVQLDADEYSQRP